MPARLLAAGEPPLLEMKAKKAHLSCGRFDAEIRETDAEEFPAIPSVSGGTSLKIAAARLKEAINQVMFAPAPDNSRPVLASVQMAVSGGKLTMIVPAEALTQVARGLPNDEDVAVAVTADQSRCRAPSAGGPRLAPDRGAVRGLQQIIPNCNYPRTGYERAGIA